MDYVICGISESQCIGAIWYMSSFSAWSIHALSWRRMSALHSGPCTVCWWGVIGVSCKICPSLLLDDARQQPSNPSRLSFIRLRQGVYFTKTETRARLVLKLVIWRTFDPLTVMMERIMCISPDANILWSAHLASPLYYPCVTASECYRLWTLCKSVEISAKILVIAQHRSNCRML